MKQLQNKMKAVRNNMDWSQEDLARYIGVSLSTAQRWETKGSKPHRMARRALEKLFRKSGINDG